MFLHETIIINILLDAFTTDEKTKLSYFLTFIQFLFNTYVAQMISQLYRNMFERGLIGKEMAAKTRLATRGKLCKKYNISVYQSNYGFCHYFLPVNYDKIELRNS